MDRGIYVASSGGMLNERRLDIVGHNLANVNTVGFKAERLVGRQQEFADTLAGLMPDGSPNASGDHDRTPGVVSTGTVTDFTVGPMNPTGDPLHAALAKENQFFVVKTPAGDAYTRAGNFTLNKDGSLVTPDGMEVQGEGGPITLTEGTPRITGNGSVLNNGELVGKLKVVQFDDLSKLQREGGARFTTKDAGTAQAVDYPDVVAGSLEMPNVGVVESMVDMIAAQRSFESYTKSVQTITELDDQALRVSRTTG